MGDRPAKSRSMRIVAPVGSMVDALAVLEAGADELYCGFMPASWRSVFGEADVLSRRQGAPAHVRDESSLERIVQAGHRLNRRVALAINGHYSAAQAPRVVDLARRWETMGGDSVIVADPGILLRLSDAGSGLDRHLSLMAGVFNAEAARFFHRLGATRIVLPRELSIDDMAVVTCDGPPVEYEALAMYQKCPFIDGLCRFYHDVRLPSGEPTEFDYEPTSALAWTHDPEYEGHGCQLPWEGAQGPVRLPLHDDEIAPPCAACDLGQLADVGVGFAKIAGRGYSAGLIVKAVRFLVQAREFHAQYASRAEAAACIRSHYASTFGGPCDRARCYYPEPDGVPAGESPR